jgi:hypothetical protein
MRYEELVETTVTDAMQQQTYYHGTSDDQNGRNIVQHGIKPGNVGHSRGHMVPVTGRSYLTSNLKYGIIYCIGGNMLGSSSDEYLINKTGRHGPASQFGWLFVISGQTLIDDVQPDEDSVGEAAMYADRILSAADSQWYAQEPLYQGLLNADRAWLKRFHWNARHSMTARQWDDALSGSVAAQASGGKRFLKRMTDADKIGLINAGAHVAYRGLIMADQAWRFDKKKTSELATDGSNFFDLAIRVH